MGLRHFSSKLGELPLSDCLTLAWRLWVPHCHVGKDCSCWVSSVSAPMQVPGILSPSSCRACLEQAGLLVFSLETAPAHFSSSWLVIPLRTLHPFIPCIPCSQCALEAPRPVSCSSHTFGKVLLRVDSSKFLLLQKKEKLGKDFCRRGGVNSSPWTQLLSGYFMGKISSHWSMAWSLGCPALQESTPIPSSFTISWLFVRVQKWMDGKANPLNLLNKIDTTQKLPKQRETLPKNIERQYHFMLSCS